MGGMKGHASVPFASGYLRSWERNSRVPDAMPSQHLERSGLQVERKKWRCPNCRRRYRVPVGCDPELCPECDPHSSSSATDPVERSKILVDQTDPFVECLSRLTGHRFSSRRLVRGAIVLALLVAAFILGELALGPIEAMGWQSFAESAAPKHPVEGPPPQNVGIVPVIRLPDFVGPPAPLELSAFAPSKPFAKAPDHVQGAEATPRGESGPSDPGMGAVRAWLKNHRDDENYQVVKWWPAKTVDSDLVSYAGLLKTDRVARLQYQDQQTDGVPFVHDQIFVIRDNVARAVPIGDNWWWDEVGGWTQLIIRGARRLLPDGNDEQTPPLADATKTPLAPLPTKLVEHHPHPAKPKSPKNRLARGAQANGLHPERRAKPWWVKYNDRADVELVRDWIRENLPDGHEARWWKPRNLIAFGWSRVPSRSAVLAMEDRPQRVFYLRAGGRLPDRHTPERVCRIKVRVDQPNKPPKIEDRLFVIASSQVEPIDDPQHKRREWKYFPEAAGEKPTADD
jgi:hypothetical protein